MCPFVYVERGSVLRLFAHTSGNPGSEAGGVMAVA